jgi:hypothetical protein
MAETKRRARGEDSIYYDRSRDRWIGSITVGWKPDGRRDRITVRGRTKTEVKDKLRAKHQELAAGVRTRANFTVAQLPEGLAGDPEHAGREHRDGLSDHGQAPDRADRQRQARRAEGA